MSLYKVPFDFIHEEKVFGGYLSLRQMLYMIASAISIGVLFIHIATVIKIIIFFKEKIFIIILKTKKIV